MDIRSDLIAIDDEIKKDLDSLSDEKIWNIASKIAPLHELILRKFYLQNRSIIQISKELELSRGDTSTEKNRALKRMHKLIISGGYSAERIDSMIHKMIFFGGYEEDDEVIELLKKAMLICKERYLHESITDPADD